MSEKGRKLTSIIAVIALLLAVFAFMGACGDDDTGDITSPDTDTTTPVVPPPAVVVPPSVVSTYTLTVARLSGMADCGYVGIKDGTQAVATYTAGTPVTVRAYENPGFTFVAWVSADSILAVPVSYDKNYTFPLNANTKLYAVFSAGGAVYGVSLGNVLDQPDLAYGYVLITYQGTTPTGHPVPTVPIAPTPNMYDMLPGLPLATTVTVRAYPKPGYTFDGWVTGPAGSNTTSVDGIVESTQNPYEFYISASKVLLAKYTGTTVSVKTMSAQVASATVPATYGRVNVFQTVPNHSNWPATPTAASNLFPAAGGRAVLLAEPQAGYDFVGWAESDDPAAPIVIPKSWCVLANAVTSTDPAYYDQYTGNYGGNWWANCWTPDPANRNFWSSYLPGPPPPVEVSAAKTYYARFDGNGTTNPKEIYTVADINAISDVSTPAIPPSTSPPSLTARLGYDYTLKANNLSVNKPIGDGILANAYTGTFEGNGRTINLHVSIGAQAPTGDNCGGLFSVIDAGGAVQNLNLTGNVQVYTGGVGNVYGGAVAGRLHGGTIENISSNVNVVAENGVTTPPQAAIAGGLVGGTTGGTIQNSFVKGSSIEAKGGNLGSQWAGGIVGAHNGGSIINCVALPHLIGAVSSAGEGHGAGVGRVAPGGATITNCWGEEFIGYGSYSASGTIPVTITDSATGRDGATTGTETLSASWWQAAAGTGAGWAAPLWVTVPTTTSWTSGARWTWGGDRPVLVQGP